MLKNSSADSAHWFEQMRWIDDDVTKPRTDRLQFLHLGRVPLHERLTYHPSRRRLNEVWIVSPYGSRHLEENAVRKRRLGVGVPLSDYS